MCQGGIKMWEKKMCVCEGGEEGGKLCATPYLVLFIKSKRLFQKAYGYNKM